MINWQHIDNLLRRHEVGLLSDNENLDLHRARAEDSVRYDNLAEAVIREFELKKAEKSQ